MGKYNWMKVADVMTRNPLSISPSETVGQAEELMSENRIRQLPVVKDRGLIGIITDRDLRSFPSDSLLSTSEERELVLGTKVNDLMTTHPVTLMPNDELQDAVELLVEEKIGGVPVIDESEHLVGIVTYIDILQCFLNRLQEE
jgi:acetoin utilization protein AcuB